MEQYRKNKHNQLNHCRQIDAFVKNHSENQKERLSSNQSGLTVSNSRQSDKSMLHQTTFNFEHVQRNTFKADHLERIHSKLSTQRIGGKVILAARQQKKLSRKENRPKQTKFQQLSKPQSRSSMRQDQERNQDNIISIKSYQPERFSCSESSLSNSRNLVKTTESSKVQAEDIFKAVRRKLEEQLQFSKKMEKKKKCFYTTLKQKLQKEVRKTASQKKRDQMTFLIEGCHAVQHCKIIQKSYLQTINTETNRPQTVTPKTCKTTLTLAEKEDRPKSCRSTVAIHSPRYFKDIKNKSERMLAKPGNERNSTQPRPTTGRYRSYQSSNPSSFLHTHRPSTPVESPHQETSEKLSQIINDCQKEHLFGDLKLNMKTFQFYCKKISEGFERAEQRIDEIKCLQID